MKSTWGIIVCLALLLGCNTSKQPVMYQLGDPIDENHRSLKQSYANEDGVYLFYHHSLAHDLKPDVTNNSPRWYFFESYHWKEVVLRDHFDTSSYPVQFAIGPHEKIRAFSVRMVYPDQRARSFDRKDLVHFRLPGDSSRYHLPADSIPDGTVFEVTYEIERGNLYKQPPTSHDVPLQLSKPVKEFAFQYTHPKDWEIQVKKMGRYREVEMVEVFDDRAETRTLTFQSSNVAAFHQELYSPTFKQVAPYFHVKINASEVGNVLETRAPQSWDGIAKRYEYMVAAPSKRAREVAKSTLRRLELGEVNREDELVQMVLGHVREDIVVVSKQEKTNIWKDKKGDPFAVAAYTRVLLEELGFESDLLLVHSTEGGYFDEDFVSEEQLFIPVLRVHVSGEETYLFPSLSYVPAGYIPPKYEHQPALLFAGGAYTGFSSLPASSRDAYRDHGQYTIYVNAGGDVRVDASLSLGDHSVYRFNQALKHREDGELSLVARLLGHHTTYQVGVSYSISEATFKQPMEIQASYMLDDCVKERRDETQLQSCGIFEPINTEWHTFDSSRRTPIVLPSDITVINEIDVIYPGGWEYKGDQFAVKKRGEAVTFERSHTGGSGTLSMTQRLDLKKKEVWPLNSTDHVSPFRLPLGVSIAALTFSTNPQRPQVALMSPKGMDPDGPWTVVASSYATYEEASKEARKLEAVLSGETYPIRIIEPGVDSDSYHVVIGVFSTRSSVETARIVLTSELPYDAWIAAMNAQMTAVLNDSEPITY